MRQPKVRQFRRCLPGGFLRKRRADVSPSHVCREDSATYYRDGRRRFCPPMKTRTLKFAATLAALSLLSLSAVSALAQTATNVISTNTSALKHTKAKAEKKEQTDDVAKSKIYPFHGTVAAVDMDKKALTITLQGKEKPRVITVGSKSLFEKDGKPATFSQVAVGDYAKGRVEKEGDKEVLLKGLFGPAPEKKTGEAKPAKKSKATTAPGTTPAATEAK